jgi:D-sedoheptulose 7-phosphate isomerase
VSTITNALKEHQTVMAELDALIPAMKQAAQQMISAIQNGNKIFWMGNGGSASDAQHLAAELIGRFKKERAALPAIALTTDSSILTCLSNDYDFSIVFSRQLEALCRPGDVVVGISTSGSSKNVISGIKTAKKLGAYTIGFSGQGGELPQLVDLALAVPSTTTARIQEAHIFIGHSICELVEVAACASTTTITSENICV